MNLAYHYTGIGIDEFEILARQRIRPGFGCPAERSRNPDRWLRWRGSSDGDAISLHRNLPQDENKCHTRQPLHEVFHKRHLIEMNALT